MTKYIVIYTLNGATHESKKFNSMLQATIEQIKLDSYGISDSTIHLVNEK